MRTSSVWRNLWRDRRGSVPLEAVMVLPVLAVVLVLANYLSQTLKTRDDFVVSVRSAAMGAALNGSCYSLSQAADTAADLLSGRLVTCGEFDEEGELQAGDRFWNRAASSSRAEGGLIPSLPPPELVAAHRARGNGYFEGLDQPKLRGSLQTFAFAVASPESWVSDSPPWAAGYDPYLHDALRSIGADELFPNVFPAGQR